MKNIIPLICSILILSCSSGISEKEYLTLKDENERLINQLEDCMFGAEKLLSTATSAFENKNFDKVISIANELKKRYPGSKEYREADMLLSSVEKELEKIKANEERRLANATKQMSKKNDEMRGITWYRDKSSPKYVNSRTSLFAYIGKEKEQAPFLRLKIQYTADDWLFIEKYIIKADDETFEITENGYGEIETDNGGGDIWEWLDRPVGQDELTILKAIANAKEVKIRFVGRQYYKDKTMSLKDKIAVQNVLDAFEALGGAL